MDSPKVAEGPAAKNNHLRQLYGLSPKTGKSPNLLHQQLEERKYFDSGDFALSQAHKSSNIGAVNTGIEHPLRNNISQPAAPVPSSSNVREEANQEARGEKKDSEPKHDSHLKQQMVSQGNGGPGGAKQEGNG